MSESSETKSKREDEEEDSKDPRMRVAGLFESTGSVNDILKEELFKSVVSNELNSLNSTSSLSPPPPSSAPANRAVSSGEFLQNMIATLSTKPGTTQAPASAAAMGPPPAPAAAAASSTKPSAKAIEDLTSSRNWNNLGSQDLNDVNVEDVFKTQQDSNDLGIFAGAKKKKGKTDWEAIQKQGLLAATRAVASAAVASAPVSNVPIPEASTSAVNTEPVPSATTLVGDHKVGKKRARTAADNGAIGAPKTAAKSKKNARKQEVKNYFEPTENDVLLGRGGRANNHPGNKKYLDLKDSIQDRYMKADKNEKTAISQELVDIVKKEWGAKFLKLDPDTNRWYEVDNVVARKKCSQSLREVNTAEVRAAKRARYSK